MPPTIEPIQLTEKLSAAGVQVESGDGRLTVRRTRKAYVAPATHYASRLTDPNLPRKTAGKGVAASHAKSFPA